MAAFGGEVNLCIAMKGGMKSEGMLVQVRACPRY